MKSDSRRSLPTPSWHTLATISWGGTAEFVLILILTLDNDFLEFWHAMAWLGALLGAAFGAALMAVHSLSEGHDGKSRALIAAFMLLIFFGLPIWTWTLPDTGAAVFGYWKLMGLVLFVPFVLLFIVVGGIRLAIGREGVSKFFRLVDTLSNYFPPLVKHPIIVIGVVVFTLVWPTISDPKILSDIVSTIPVTDLWGCEYGNILYTVGIPETEFAQIIG